jgi:hypothetical protein
VYGVPEAGGACADKVTISARHTAASDPHINLITPISAVPQSPNQ